MPDISELSERLSAVEEQLKALQDADRIRELLHVYGFDADLGRVSSYLDNWVDDCEYEQGEGRSLLGKDAIRTIIAPADSPHKQALENRSQHLVGNLVGRVEGDTAWAEGYSFVLHRTNGENKIWSCAYNQWDFRRISSGWKIVRRRRRAIGDSGSGRDVLFRYLEPPVFDR